MNDGSAINGKTVVTELSYEVPAEYKTELPIDFPPVRAHELIEAQVARTPNATAIVHGARKISYLELNQRANRLAHRLQSLGVGPDRLAAVCLDRSPELVVALLAVWKAGGAYVPLDPGYPSERLSFMVSDSRATILLTKQGHRHLVSCRPETPVLCLDSEWPSIEDESADNLGAAGDPSNLAYVMYTSGSTGTPKGAMIEHRGLVNYLWWAKSFYAVEPGLSVPVHSSVSFDLTVTSLYTPLVVGGEVELIDDDAGAQNLVTALQTRPGRGLIKITPAHLELLSSHLSPEQAQGVARVFVIGGENLRSDSLRMWRTLNPPPRLINEYGPTETVVGCCIHEVSPDDPMTGSVPIGRPIANMQMHVLDSELAPVPPGTTGELYIGGIGVGRGYVNNPVLSAERFIADPFSKRPGARLYRTGDHGSWRLDGTLEFFGRLDDQVKIRGHRIELAEVEAGIASHPDVRSCAAVAHADERGFRQLLAYVVAHGSHVLDAGAIRDFLKNRLPNYMVPARITQLDALPLTSNGKVDRKALMNILHEGISAAISETARTPTEKTMAGLWQELLLLPNISRDDDFFNLRGDSLSVVRLLVQIQTTFGVTIELAQIFEYPTIAGLSQLIDTLVLTNPRVNASEVHVKREEFDL